MNVDRNAKMNDDNGTHGQLVRRACSGRREGRSWAGIDRHPITLTDHPQHLRTLREASPWNIRTLFHPGKLDNVSMEMDRLRISALDIKEVRRTNVGQIKKNDQAMICSGRITRA